MVPQNLAIPKGSLILVSGANGFIGSHVVDQLLQLDYNVRGTVRDEKPWLNKVFDDKYGKGRFETVVVPTIEKEGAFDDVLDGVSGFIHVASDVSMGSDPNKVIPVAVNGVKNFLEAAAKHPDVKRVVLTSSSSAALTPVINKKVVVDIDTWNDQTVKNAWDPDFPKEKKPVAVYSASKTEAEKEAWKWLKSHDHQFGFNAILPNYNIGPRFHEEIHGSTMGWMINLLKGDASVIGNFTPQYYVDVRDAAKLHVIALLDPEVNDERIFAFADQFNWTDAIQQLKKLRPQNTKLPSPPENEGRDLSEIKPKKRAGELLQNFYGQNGWTNFETSLTEGIDTFE